MMSIQQSPSISIAATAVHEPEWNLSTEWFLDRGVVGKSFCRQAGIDFRRISKCSEEEMANEVISSVLERTGLHPEECRFLVLVSASLAEFDSRLPLDLTNPVEATFAAWPNVQEVAELVAYRAAVGGEAKGINWGCSGYIRALELCDLRHKDEPLNKNEYMLIVTANRLTGRVDFSQSVGAVFGDYATATVLAVDNDDFWGKKLQLLCVESTMRDVGEVGFSIEAVSKIKYPTEDGGEVEIERDHRLTMNGEVIAENAPAILIDRAERGLEALELPNDGVAEWLHHQPGKFVSRYFATGLEERGIAGLVHNDVSRLGNLSSSSIPKMIHQRWDELEGVLGCPSVGAGIPGRTLMSEGVAMFRVNVLG